MKIRKKLFLGFGLLFIVVLFFGVVSAYYIEDISETAKITLKNNYETLTFTREMRSVLNANDLPLTSQAADKFNTALKKQEHNITETGEREATGNVRADFGALTSPATSLTEKQVTEKRIRWRLDAIDGLNMTAIERKSASIRETVNNATLFLGAVGFITFLVLFVLIANFPGFIINPLHQFAEGLMEISRKNYDVRLDFKTSNEFTELSKAFNVLAEELSDLDNANATRVLSEEARIKAMIEETGVAILGVNEKNEILFMNTPAVNIFGLEDKQLVNRPVHEFTRHSSLLKTVLENTNPDEPFKVSHGKKTVYLQQKNLEIVVPNLRPNVLDAVQFSGFAAGMVYVLKEVTEPVASEK
jgi:two-component system, NtrC family, sensor histidine kinase KinB